MLRIEPGARPWKPAHDAQLIQELNYYDMPICGILEQDGTRYLFANLTGPATSAHLWAYRRVTDAEFDAIAEAEPGEPSRRVVHDLMADGAVQVAVAADEDGVLGSTEARSTAESDLKRAMEQILRSYEQRLDAQRSRAAEIRDVLAKSAV